MGRALDVSVVYIVRVVANSRGIRGYVARRRLPYILRNRRPFLSLALPVSTCMYVYSQLLYG